MPQNGYFLIADITGYTAYLNQSELDHAQHILTSLLNLLIAHTKPPLILSRLAGDAVISYGLRDHFFQGQTFLEMLEDTYVAFRRAIDLMVLNTTCPCNACKNIASLDLKFFVHYGTFGIQKLDAHDELVGSDVIVIHRLLKNHVTEKTGCRAYALFTHAAIQQLGIENPEQFLKAHRETYEHLGKVKVWIQNMHPVWDKRATLKIEIPPAQLLTEQSADFPVPVEVMWDVLADPNYRSPILNAIRQEIHHRQHGRIVPGSAFRCYHGDGRVTTQTVLEWRPFEQMTTEDTTPVPKTTVLVQFHLSPLESPLGKDSGLPGTRLTVRASTARGPWLNRKICDLVGKKILATVFQKGLQVLRTMLEQDLATGKYSLSPPVHLPLQDIQQAALDSLAGE